MNQYFNKLNYLKEINIDFNKLKRMTIYINNSKQEDSKEKININLFETFFSFENIQNNLIYLNIKFKNDYNINPDLFENINNFKLLRYLYMNSFNFDNNFQ